MFRIDLLPAGPGDCLLISYGSKKAPHRILIDGGVEATGTIIEKTIAAWPEDQQVIELLVVTHIDADHIGGVLEWLKRLPTTVIIQNIWFNGWEQLSPSDLLGARQGEALTQLIKEKKWPHNRQFSGGAVAVPSNGTLPVITLPGGMQLTILSPGATELANVRKVWDKVLQNLAKKKELKEAKSGDLLGAISLSLLSEIKFNPDTSAANGSSIALLAEYNGVRCLFAADAFEKVLRKNIARLRNTPHEKLKLDAFKLPHHGSKKNVSVQLIDMVECSRYLISTDGTTHGHPDLEAISRVLLHGGQNPELFFNYRNAKISGLWGQSHWQKQKVFSVHFGKAGTIHLVL
jgi:beta-lactamase superfamily II metal-dependent hydrolase